MRKISLTCIFLMLFSFSFISDISAQQLMAFEEVEKLIYASPNQEVDAYFDTVERGINVKRFGATLRGIHSEPGLKVIMFVTKHSIAAGMSGSPVYIKGKLVGALAYAFNSPRLDNDWFWGGISPISFMIEEADSGSGSFSLPRAFNYSGMDFHPISLGYEFGATSSNGVGNLLHSVSGSSLKPGMPIVVDLAEWNEKNEVTTMSGTGTITYIDGNGRIFAFGHPFLGARNVTYSFRTGEIVGTPQSQPISFKLTGRKSDVLGVITYDGTYGIYGSIQKDQLEKLHSFNLEFKNGGKPTHQFDIKISDSVLTPMLARQVFEIIGNAYGAPMPQEPSVTQLDVRIDLTNGQSIAWNELFASSAAKFGPSIIYTSSYQAAQDAFFGLYNNLFENSHGLRMLNVFVSADFILGKSQILKLADYRFPNKVIYGQNPVLQVLLVSQDNSIALTKEIDVNIDWSKVEKPVYSKGTLDTDKAGEKVVRGSLHVASTRSFLNGLTSDERQKLLPDYFLGADDFLKNLSSRLEATNQKIYAKVLLKSRSGLLDEIVAGAEDIIPKDVPENSGSDWSIIEGGLADRKTTIRDEGVVIFYLDLPPAPTGYVVDQNLNERVYFEIVLDQ